MVARKRVDRLRPLRFRIDFGIGSADDPEYVGCAPAPAEDAEILAGRSGWRLERAVSELHLEGLRNALRARHVVDGERVAAEGSELGRLIRARGDGLGT